MRRFILIVGMALSMILMVSAMAQDEAPFFDLKNCDFCKNLTTDPELLNHMNWEHHVISNGELSVTVVDEAYQDSYVKAQQAMEKLGQEMMAGKTDVKMCRHCQYYGQMMMAGAKTEMLHTCGGDIVLITSDNPETVAMIKEYARLCTEGLAAMGAPTKE